MGNFLKAAVVAVVLMSAVSVTAAEITVAAGAGFRKMVTDVAAECEKDFGVKVNMSFGNLGQVIAQVKTTGLIDAVIGDAKFFKRVGLGFEQEYLLGNGKLVLAWRKGLSMSSPQELKKEEFQKVAIPNIQKAIYGIAGTEYMAYAGLTDAVKEKLYVVATVPQVSSYLAAGEVDAGFSNLTDIRGVADKIGGFILLEEGYTKINIITGFIEGHADTEGMRRYQKCVTSDQVRKIAQKHGL